MSGYQSQQTNDSEQPNVVLITSHDLGQHVGCYGVETVRTPRIDGLAASGRRFENAYATTPVCTPSRASLLTGRYPQSHGLMGLTHAPWWWELNDGEIALPEMLSEAGYETHLFGFQHVVSDASRLGVRYDHGGVDATQPTAHPIDAEQVTANAAVLFETVGSGDSGALAADADVEIDEVNGPFFAQIGFKEVHRTFDQGQSDDRGVFVPPYLESTEQIRDDFAAYQASIEYLDDRVGEILDALNATGLREETVVIFATDHGIPFPGAKWSCRRPGLEIALLMDGPDEAFEGPAADWVTSNIDVLPTLCDALGIPIPDRVEGVSHYDRLVSDTEEPPRTAAYAQYTPEMKRDNESRSMITADRHLIRYFDQGRSIDYPVDVDPVAVAAHEERMPAEWGARPFAQLYDPVGDPYELDAIETEETTVADLSAQLLRWMVAVDDPLLEGRVRLPYYERAIDDLLTTSTRDPA